MYKLKIPNYFPPLKNLDFLYQAFSNFKSFNKEANLYNFFQGPYFLDASSAHDHFQIEWYHQPGLCLVVELARNKYHNVQDEADYHRQENGNNPVNTVFAIFFDLYNFTIGFEENLTKSYFSTWQLGMPDGLFPTLTVYNNISNDSCVYFHYHYDINKALLFRENFDLKMSPCHGVQDEISKLLERKDEKYVSYLKYDLKVILRAVLGLLEEHVLEVFPRDLSNAELFNKLYEDERSFLYTTRRKDKKLPEGVDPDLNIWETEFLKDFHEKYLKMKDFLADLESKTPDSAPDNDPHYMQDHKFAQEMGLELRLCRGEDEERDESTLLFCLGKRKEGYSYEDLNYIYIADLIWEQVPGEDPFTGIYAHVNYPSAFGLKALFMILATVHEMTASFDPKRERKKNHYIDISPDQIIRVEDRIVNYGWINISYPNIGVKDEFYKPRRLFYQPQELIRKLLIAFKKEVINRFSEDHEVWNSELFKLHKKYYEELEEYLQQISPRNLDYWLDLQSEFKQAGRHRTLYEYFKEPIADILEWDDCNYEHYYYPLKFYVDNEAI